MLYYKPACTLLWEIRDRQDRLRSRATKKETEHSSGQVQATPLLCCPIKVGNRALIPQRWRYIPQTAEDRKREKTGEGREERERAKKKNSSKESRNMNDRRGFGFGWNRGGDHIPTVRDAFSTPPSAASHDTFGGLDGELHLRESRAPGASVASHGHMHTTHRKSLAALL